MIRMIQLTMIIHMMMIIIVVMIITLIAIQTNTNNDNDNDNNITPRFHAGVAAAGVRPRTLYGLDRALAPQ